MKRKVWSLFLAGIMITMCACGNVEEVQNVGGVTDKMQEATSTPNVTEKPEDTPKPTAEPTPDPTATPVPEPTPTPEPEVVSIMISAAGDVTLGNTHLQGYDGTFRKEYDDQQNPGYFFQNVKDIFEADDMTIVNFEGVLTFHDERVEKAFNLKGDPEYINILTEGSVEAVSFGNNHRMDYGQQGSDDTVAAFKEAGISYAYDEFVGTYEVKGITVGFVSVNEVYDGEAVEVFLEEGIKELQQKEVDLIIACCHWGIETHHYIEDYQAELGRKCIDWGADLVLGHHPHVLQGIEEYNDRYIVYSLGNFCFGGNKNPKNKDTMIFQKTFTFIDGELQLDDDIRIIPCSISSVKNRNNFQPTPAEGDAAKKIIDKVNQYSKGFGIQFDYDGRLEGNEVNTQSGSSEDGKIKCDLSDEWVVFTEQSDYEDSLYEKYNLKKDSTQKILETTNDGMVLYNIKENAFVFVERKDAYEALSKIVTQDTEQIDAGLRRTEEKKETDNNTPNDLNYKRVYEGEKNRYIVWEHYDIETSEISHLSYEAVVAEENINIRFYGDEDFLLNQSLHEEAVDSITLELGKN